MQPNFSATPSYEVILRNTSGKAVNALEVQNLQGSRLQLSTMPQGKAGQPLILPGGTYQMAARLANRVHGMFPQEAQTERLKHVIELGMKGIRGEVLNDITQFEIHHRRAEGSDFGAWLTSAKNRYQAWLARL